MPAKLALLCAATFIIGYILSMYLYRIQHKQFKGSSLQTKIHLWIPIFLLVAIFTSGLPALSIVVTVALLLLVVREYVRTTIPAATRQISIIYVCFVLAGTIAMAGLAHYSPALFASVWFMSVLSDVTAFFIGNFAGKFKLPAYLNPGKSWDGAIGQLAGSLLAALLIGWLLEPVPVWLWLAVGVGSLCGDLANSYIKRRLGQKDWSQSIPGHGGYLDRLSSLSFASLLAYIGLRILG